MSEIIKVGVLGIIGVLLAVHFKTNKPEYGMYIGFSLSILIFSYGLRQAPGSNRTVRDSKFLFGSI